MLAGIDLHGMIQRSTASGWILCLLAVVGIWRLYVIGRPKMLELEIVKDSGLRKEFIEEMAALRDEVKGLRDENAELRKEIRELHGVIDGMRRENLSAQLAEQRVVAAQFPQTPQMERALRTLKEKVSK